MTIGYRLYVTASFIAGFLLFLGYWAYSDQHNDARYVAKETYEQDKRTAAELLKEKDRTIQQSLTALEKTAIEIQKDVREIRYKQNQ